MLASHFVLLEIPECSLTFRLLAGTFSEREVALWKLLQAGKT